MRNYFSIINLNSLILGLFIILFLGYLFGIRFDNLYANSIVGLILYFSPICALVLVIKEKFKTKYLKTTLATLLAVASLVSLLPISFTVLDFASLNGGIDPSFEKIRSQDLGSSRIVTYRTNGGATVDFGTVVRLEKPILPGVYIKRDLLDIYHASDVEFSVVGQDYIRIDSINFSSAQRKAEYMSEKPEIVEGKEIKI